MGEKDMERFLRTIIYFILIGQLECNVINVHEG